MYTGYFAKLKTYEKAGLVPVSIALKAPDWYKGLEYKDLAPNWNILSNWKNSEHIATMDSYNKRLVTFEKLDKPDCLGSNLKHLHEYDFSEITEALLQDLHLYTTEEATAERCLERNF